MNDEVRIRRIVDDELYVGSFFFNDTATTEIYTLSLHDALPIWRSRRVWSSMPSSSTSAKAAERFLVARWVRSSRMSRTPLRSEEHTSELQSRQYLVCRLLLEKKQHSKPLHSILSHSSIPLVYFC